MSAVELDSDIGGDVQVGRALKAFVVLAAVAAGMGGGVQAQGGGDAQPAAGCEAHGELQEGGGSQEVKW